MHIYNSVCMKNLKYFNSDVYDNSCGGGGKLTDW